jgi:drug/metabolite transporter (DMT)-like permease
MTNGFLYAATVLIWGTTWFAIIFQLGIVAPEVSIVWRFLTASLTLFGWCLITRRSVRFPAAAHVWMALQGCFLFSGNYLIFYFAQFYVTSGLVAVSFSLIIVFNIGFGALLFAQPVRPRVVAGAVVGLAGIALLFLPEFERFDLSDDGFRGMLMCIGGTMMASFGNLISGRNQRSGLPVIQTNAWGMLYGSLLAALVALVLGRDFIVDWRAPYVLSLIYLSLFGSVIAFGAYLTLLGRIGADRAAYATVLFPLVALALSTLFEGYSWTLSALFGVVLVVAGNILALAPVRLPSVAGRFRRQGAGG